MHLNICVADARAKIFFNWLRQVEIVMGLEEEFGINVTDDGAENITTVQEAADLIEGLIQKKDWGN